MGRRHSDLALADPPDVTILDLFMPRIDRWKVAKRLRAEPSTADLPLIVLPASATEQNRRRAEDTGPVRCEAVQPGRAGPIRAWPHGWTETSGVVGCW
jgi:CheY-like chemotaxis protein